VCFERPDRNNHSATFLLLSCELENRGTPSLQTYSYVNTSMLTHIYTGQGGMWGLKIRLEIAFSPLFFASLVMSSYSTCLKRIPLTFFFFCFFFFSI